MPNSEKQFPHNEIAFIDRDGREQRGTVVEILSQPDRGVKTVQDAVALSYYALMLDLQNRGLKDGDKEAEQE